MNYTKVFNNTHIITSEFDEQLFLEGLRAQLSSKIFKELINGEKDGLKLTVSMEVIDEPDERFKLIQKKAIDEFSENAKALVKELDEDSNLTKDNSIFKYKIIKLEQAIRRL